MNKRVVLAVLTSMLVWQGPAQAHSDASGFAAESHHHPAQPAEQAGPRRFPATVRLDPRKVENVILKVNARITELEDVFVGRRVSAGEQLAAFESAELETLQRTYLETFRNLQRIGQISMTTEEKLIEGRMNLEWRGVPADNILLIEDFGQPLREVGIHAPVDGRLVEIRAVQGQIVNPGTAAGLFTTAGTTVFRIAHDDAVLIEAELGVEDSAALEPGSPATIWVGEAGAPRRAIRAWVDQVSALIEPASQRRMVRIKPVPEPGVEALREGTRVQVSLEVQS